MKAAVLGSGMMGSVVAWDLARSAGVDEVVVADLDLKRLEAVKKRAGQDRLSTEVLDIKNQERVAKFLQGFDVSVSALPHGVVHSSDLAAVKAGTKMVNIAFEDEQMELDGEAKESGALLIPGCGVAPGLGGILLAHGLEALGGGDEGHIMVGGLPQDPKPPFGYRLVFSVVGLLREYTDEARIFRDGELARVKPFDTLETIEFPPPIGKLEAFCTDGLASLVYTMKGMKVMDEKTLRWPGHVEKMGLLMDSGYFSKEKLRLGDAEVAPIEMSWAVLGRKLSEGEVRDFTVMRVVARSGNRAITYDMVDRFDEVEGITSMGRTTGYTASIVAQMIGAGEIRGEGVVAPERAVVGKEVDKLLSELDSRGVVVSATRSA